MGRGAASIGLFVALCWVLSACGDPGFTITTAPPTLSTDAAPPAPTSSTAPPPAVVTSTSGPVLIDGGAVEPQGTRRALVRSIAGQSEFWRDFSMDCGSVQVVTDEPGSGAIQLAYPVDDVGVGRCARGDGIGGILRFEGAVLVEEVLAIEGVTDPTPAERALFTRYQDRAGTCVDMWTGEEFSVEARWWCPRTAVIDVVRLVVAASDRGGVEPWPCAIVAVHDESDSQVNVGAIVLTYEPSLDASCRGESDVAVLHYRDGAPVEIGGQEEAQLPLEAGTQVVCIDLETAEEWYEEPERSCGWRAPDPAAAAAIVDAIASELTSAPVWARAAVPIECAAAAYYGHGGPGTHVRVWYRPFMRVADGACEEGESITGYYVWDGTQLLQDVLVVGARTRARLEELDATIWPSRGVCLDPADRRFAIAVESSMVRCSIDKLRAGPFGYGA